jgi:hypothetical protein
LRTKNSLRKFSRSITTIRIFSAELISAANLHGTCLAGDCMQSEKDVRHFHKYALLIIDMFNRFGFPGGADLAASSLPIARQIAGLKKRARADAMPILYVNDNFGQWRSEWTQVYKKCAREDSLGHAIAKLLTPQPEDYFVL